MTSWGGGARWDGPPDSYYDPPDDPPMISCPRCDGTGRITKPEGTEVGPGRVLEADTEYDCGRCDGSGEDYATDEEVRDAAAEAAIERAEARRDGDY